MEEAILKFKHGMLSRIFKLGLLTTLANIYSNMKTLSFFLVHVQRLWK